ncbi:hypothetical protein [Tepidimonas sp.]|uniref:hypothetical protein n=1 Tax=Tepidimonas sp. TaxID=2002775 RepID=UPI002FDF42D0
MGAEPPTLRDRYWSQPVLQANLLVFADLLGALALGLLVGEGPCAAAILLSVLTALRMLWGGRRHFVVAAGRTDLTMWSVAPAGTYPSVLANSMILR